MRTCRCFAATPWKGRYPQLEGTGKGLRHLKFRYGQPIDAELVREVVNAGLDLMFLPEDPDEPEGA
jgi:hypothetical protein